MISAFRQKSSDGASKGQGDLIQRFHGLSLAGVAPQVASEKSGYRWLLSLSHWRVALLVRARDLVLH